MIEELRDLQATATLGATVSVIQGNLTAPPQKFAAAARLFARTLADPALPADRLADMARNRATVSRQADGNAETLAQRLLARLVIADGPHRRSATGDPGDVRARDASPTSSNGGGIFWCATASSWSRSARWTRPRPVARSIGLFAGLPQRGSALAPVKPVLRAPGKLVVLERAVVQTAIAAGGPASLAVTPDLARTQLAVAAFGGGPSARLWLAVRERLGAAYGISAGPAVGRSRYARALHPHGGRQRQGQGRARGHPRGICPFRHGRNDRRGARAAEVDFRDGTSASGCAGRRRSPPICSRLALHDFPDDYLATYEQRLRGYERSGGRSGCARDVSKRAADHRGGRSVGRGTCGRLRDQVARGARALRVKLFAGISVML